MKAGQSHTKRENYEVRQIVILRCHPPSREHSKPRGEYGTAGLNGPWGLCRTHAYRKHNPHGCCWHQHWWLPTAMTCSALCITDVTSTKFWKEHILRTYKMPDTGCFLCTIRSLAKRGWSGKRFRIGRKDGAYS